MWQILSAFGVGRPKSQTDKADGVSSKRDFVAERIAHSRGEGPKPEPDAPGPGANVVSMTARLGN